MRIRQRTDRTLDLIEKREKYDQVNVVRLSAVNKGDLSGQIMHNTSMVVRLLLNLPYGHSHAHFPTLQGKYFNI